MLTCLLLVLCMSLQVNAQKQITEFLEIELNDAKVLSEAYLRPYGEMLGRTMNAGWYNVASVHSILGFDLNFGVNISSVPSVRKTFNVSDCLSEMSPGWTLGRGSSELAPTIAGKMKNRPVIEKGANSLTLPDGINWGTMPLPTIQVGLGLPFHTDVICRFFPKVNIADYGKIGLLGFGLKHDIKGYLPVIKHLPILQTSLLLGYTRMNMNINIDYAGVQGATDHELNVIAQGFTGRLLIGAKLPIISLYAGLGYGNSKSNFDLKGSYKVDNDTVKDPFSLDYNENTFDANIGLRLKFGIVTLHGDYCLGAYPIISAGLGISIR